MSENKGDGREQKIDPGYVITRIKCLALYTSVSRDDSTHNNIEGERGSDDELGREKMG